MRDWIRGHRFASFYGLAVAIVALVMLVRSALDYSEVLPGLFSFLQQRQLYPNVVSIVRFGLEDARALLIFAFAGAPTIAALVISGLADGWAGLRRLLGRLRPWRAGVSTASGLRIYAELALIYLLGAAGYLWAASRWGEPGDVSKVLDLLGGSVPMIGLWLVIGPFLDEGGFCEELGWRGYGLPLLVDRLRSPWIATLVLGALWWLWHFPREIPNLLSPQNLRVWAFYQGLFLVLCLALSVVISWYFFRTGGSALPGLLIHGFTNVWSKALGAPINTALDTDVRTWLVIGLAILVLIVTRGRLGWRQDLPEEVYTV